MRLTSLLAFSLSTALALPAQAASHCTSREHAAAAVPLAEQFISSPAQVRRSIEQQVAQNPQLEAQKEMLIQQVSGMMESPKYQKGMISVICKNFTPAELQGKDTRQQAVVDQLLQPKLGAIKRDIENMTKAVAGQ